MAEVLNVSIRKSRGTSHARRERADGKIPAVLYGHGEETVCLSVSNEEIQAALRHGAHFVELKGESNESALIQEVQWDTFGVDVLHVDLTRAKAGESHKVTVAIELRGDAPGTKEGGVVQQQLREVEIDCPVTAIPEKLTMNINSLGLDQSLTAGELKLPEGAKLMFDPEATVVQCVMMAAEEEEEEGEAAAATAEPEIIGRKPEDEEGGGED